MTTIGVLGGRWRATVSAAGSIEPWDGSPTLDWFIAADDRWHVPSQEPVVRQVRVDGAPVLETRVKVPSGDAVQRVWCVADHGGMTVIEIENDSTLPFAVAFNRGDILSMRSPANVPIEGISLPEGSVVFPIGHRSVVQFGLAHSAGQHALPAGLATASQVARGWTATVDRAGRILVPDEAVAADIVRRRGELALGGPVDPVDDPVGFLIDVGQLVRLGERAEGWVPDIAEAVEAAVRQHPGVEQSWDLQAALDAAGVVLHRAGESRALRDLARLRQSTVASMPMTVADHRRLAWHELALARSMGGGRGDLLSGGLPGTWLGANFEVYDLPIGADSTVSYAVRWHGDRPAVLWETTGSPVALTASVIAPDWSTTESKGEALWPAPIS
jgi:hypothetical protein